MTTHEDPQDVRGCAWAVLRTTGCIAFLWVVMLAAILLAGLFLLIFS